MSRDLCKICKGAQNLFCVQAGAKEWYPCPACGGAGVRSVGFPRELPISRAQMKYMRPNPQDGDPGSSATSPADQ